MILPLVGQRVEVLLRGENKLWFLGTGQVSGVQLDDTPPGMTSRWVVGQDIHAWLPSLAGDPAAADRPT